MITLYHCDGARSFRPLWMLEEMGLAYELKMLPFPPRVLAKDYLAINPLGTIPFLIDGDTRMTESSGICHYLGVKYGPTPLMVGPDETGYGVMQFSGAPSDAHFAKIWCLSLGPMSKGGAFAPVNVSMHGN